MVTSCDWLRSLPPKVLIRQSYLVPNQAAYILGTFCAGLGRQKTVMVVGYGKGLRNLWSPWVSVGSHLASMGDLMRFWPINEPSHLCTVLSSQNLLEHVIFKNTSRNGPDIFFQFVISQKFQIHQNRSSPCSNPVLHERIPHSCHSPTCLKSQTKGQCCGRAINEFVS